MLVTGNPFADKHLSAMEIGDSYKTMSLSYYCTLYECHRLWSPNETSYIVRVGRLDLLKYAYEHGCPWHVKTTSIAAFNGSLDCLRYAHENGCPWDVETCSNAASANQVECLRYAHQNGCLWDAKTCYTAIKNGSMKCVEYAHQHGYSTMFPGSDARDISPACYTFLHQHNLIY